MSPSDPCVARMVDSVPIRLAMGYKSHDLHRRCHAFLRRLEILSNQKAGLLGKAAPAGKAIDYGDDKQTFSG